MRQAAVSAYVKLEDYFEREASCGADAPRHEWLDGVVYAMSRGTPEHGRLTSSVTTALGNVLPPDGQIYAADTMLYIPAANLATYADASAVCGPLETITVRKDGRSLGQAVTNPVVIIEVLSESTERYDRDGKFQLYRQIASLREYVLIAQDERRIEVFRREQAWHARSQVRATRFASTVRSSGWIASIGRELGPRRRRSNQSRRYIVTTQAPV